MRDGNVPIPPVNGHHSRAAHELLEIVYGELCRLAAAKMAREPATHTLDATGLVHEAWLRLGGDNQPRWQNHAHFFAAAAEAMRRILIDAARRRRAERRGGGMIQADVDPATVALTTPERDTELLAVHEVLGELEAHDSRKAQVVKLRYFAGLTLEQAADVLGVSVVTAKRDWAYARAWLFNRLNDGGLSARRLR